jgi:hypothetical protein
MATSMERQTQAGYRREAISLYPAREREGFLRVLHGFRQTTIADLERNERLAWGSPEQTML